MFSACCAPEIRNFYFDRPVPAREHRSQLDRSYLSRLANSSDSMNDEIISVYQGRALMRRLRPEWVGAVSQFS